MSAEELKIIEEKVAEVVQEGIKYEELHQKYVKWAQDYDKDMNVWGYKSPGIAAKEVSAILGERKDAKILDVCAGTGMTGQAIYNAGYKNLEAADGNPGMLEEAKKKNIYKELHQVYLGKPLNFPQDSYDMVALFGALCDGHVSPDCFGCFRDICKIIKPGGYFIGGIVKDLVTDVYRQKLEAAFQDVTSNSLWEQVANKLVEDGSYVEQVWIFRVK